MGEDALDEIALRLAAEPIWFQSAMRPLKRRPIRGLIPSLRMMMRMPKAIAVAQASVLAYHRATGQSWDDAVAAIAVVRQRLQHIGLADAPVAFTDAEIQDIARFLVRWVAAGRPANPVMAEVDEAYGELEEIRRSLRRRESPGPEYSRWLQVYNEGWGRLIRPS